MKRGITINKLPTTDPTRFLKIEVSYDAGGPNYFTGGMKERGYYMSVAPHKEVAEGVVSVLTFSGVSHFLESAARFNRNRLEQLAAQGDKLPRYQDCITHVLTKNNLTLSETKEVGQ